MRAWGMNPDELLTREASANPNATVICQDRYEDNQIRQLSLALKQQMLKEIRESQKMKYINEKKYELKARAISLCSKLAPACKSYFSIFFFQKLGGITEWSRV
jgi:hypothetical protein